MSNVSDIMNLTALIPSLTKYNQLKQEEVGPPPSPFETSDFSIVKDDNDLFKNEKIDEKIETNKELKKLSPIKPINADEIVSIKFC